MSAQSMEALAYANEVRFAISSYKAEVRALGYHAGLRYVAEELLRDPLDPVCRSMRVGDLVKSIHGYGDVRAWVACRKAGVTSVDRRVGDLTLRQREVIAQALTSLLDWRDAGAMERAAS